MPWQNNNGGPWGGGGGNDQGPRNPWGQGGGAGGPPPRNLDDIIRKGQEKLRQTMTGGSGQGGAGGRNVALLAGLALLALWIVSTSFYRVQADEVGVVQRFGAYVRQTGPGLNFKLPSPIETVATPKVTQENSIDIGTGEENLFLTGDRNIVDIGYTVRWRIRPGEADRFLYTLKDQETTIREVAEFAMREAVSRTPLVAAIGPQRAQIAQSVQNRVQETLDSYHAGINISGVFFSKVDPPSAVEQAFKDVSAAQQDAQTYINQSNAYRQQVLSRAQGETARFNALYEQFRLAPAVTRKRLYLETMEEVLRGVDKVIVEPGGVVPYLPLDSVGKPRAPVAADPAVASAAPAAGK